MALKPFEQSIHQLGNTRMLVLGRKSARDSLVSCGALLQPALAPLMARYWNRFNGARITSCLLLSNFKRVLGKC